VDSTDPYKFEHLSTTVPSPHAPKWPFPFDFVVLLAIAPFVFLYQPPRETGPFQAAAYIEHLRIYIPGLCAMGILCISIIRNKWRPRIVRVIAGLLLVPVLLLSYTPVITLIEYL
jgi:hypothetical protein